MFLAFPQWDVSQWDVSTVFVFLGFWVKLETTDVKLKTFNGRRVVDVTPSGDAVAVLGESVSSTPERTSSGCAARPGSASMGSDANAAALIAALFKFNRFTIHDGYTEADQVSTSDACM